LLVFVFPGVFLRGEAISPSDVLGAIPPWRGYVEYDANGPNHRLMSDVVTAFHPYYALTRAALDRGEWPLWNPLEYSGMPLLANCQSSVFYPPRLLHAFLDVRVATTFFIILKLWLCGMMAYACARGMRLTRGAARFFSVAWMLASYNLIWANWSLPDVSAWVPMLFLGIELVLGGRYRRGFFATAAGGTLIFLGGHPETALTMCLGLGLYFALRLALDGRRGRRLWAPVAVAAGAALSSLLVCAPVLLPFIEYLLNSHTFFSRTENLQNVLPPGAALCLWLPRFFGTSVDGNFWAEENSNLLGMLYPGLAAWAGIALLCATRRGAGSKATGTGLAGYLRGIDKLTASLAVAAAAGLLLAFDFPGIGALVRLPVLSSTRVCYFATFALFAMPLLGTIGLDRYLAGAGKFRDLLWLVPMAALVSLLVGFELRLAGPLLGMLRVAPYIHGQVVVGVCIVALACAAIAAAVYFRRKTVWWAVLTAILAADLIYANRGLNPTMPLKQVFPETRLTDYLRTLGDHRIGFPEGNIPSGLMAPYGLEDWQAYDGLYPQRMWRFTNDMAGNLWGKFEPLRSIAYYLNDPTYPPAIPKEKLARLEPVAQMDGLQVLKNNDALPRAYLVPRIETAPGVSELIAKLADPAFDPRETALTEAPLPHSLPASNIPAAELGTARVTYRGGTRVVVEAEAKADCVLVLSDAYYPGWTATIDGAPAEIFPAYYVYRGLLLPAGQHEIVYTYMPWTFKAGMAVSVAALAGMLVALLVLRRRTAHK
jgi:hypothetical protein